MNHASVAGKNPAEAAMPAAGMNPVEVVGAGAVAAGAGAGAPPRGTKLTAGTAAGARAPLAVGGNEIMIDTFDVDGDARVVRPIPP